MNSSKKSDVRDLATKKLKTFLEHLANRQLESEHVSFMERFGEFFPEIEPGWTGGGSPVLRGLETDEGRDFRMLFDLQSAVRTVWLQEDLLTRRHQVHLLLEKMLVRRSPRFIINAYAVLPPLTPSELAFLRLADLVGLTKKCSNPDCQSPYFIAGRSSQVYCSTVCAAPAQKKAKQDWWNNHGPQWRRNRDAKNKRAKKKTGKARKR